eukprot:scaffold90185_cov31-Tisochrysis_lutea.AAC.3
MQGLPPLLRRFDVDASTALLLALASCVSCTPTPSSLVITCAGSTSWSSRRATSCSGPNSQSIGQPSSPCTLCVQTTCTLSARASRYRSGLPSPTGTLSTSQVPTWAEHGRPAENGHEGAEWSRRQRKAKASQLEREKRAKGVVEREPWKEESDE